MKEFRRKIDEMVPGTHQERLDYLYEVLTAPITYARQLKDTVSTKVGRGLKGEILGTVAAIAPVAIPLTFTAVEISRGNVAGGVLGGLFFWGVSSAIVYVLHDEGAIGPKMK